MEQKLVLIQKPRYELIFLQRYQEVLVLTAFTVSAALMRSAMQFIPSFEPITFFAVLAGFMYGKTKGFMVGATSLYLSNFMVFGGQGPWTPFQMLSFGLAGYIAGMFHKNNYLNAFIVMLVSTLTFEFIMNSYSAVFFGSGILAFISALPFAATHLGTNIGLGFLLPNADKYMSKISEKLKLGDNN